MTRLIAAIACTLGLIFLLIGTTGLVLRFGFDRASLLATLMTAVWVVVTAGAWRAATAAVDAELADDDWQDHCGDPDCRICPPGPASGQL